LFLDQKGNFRRKGKKLHTLDVAGVRDVQMETAMHCRIFFGTFSAQRSKTGNGLSRQPRDCRFEEKKLHFLTLVSTFLIQEQLFLLPGHFFAFETNSSFCLTIETAFFVEHSFQAVSQRRFFFATVYFSL